MVLVVSLGILVFALGASLYKGRSFRFDKASALKKVFFASVLLLSFLLLYFSFAQYRLWLGSEISKYFLPPYQSIFYFLFYVGMRFFIPYGVSLAAAGLVFYVMTRMNRRYGEKFFYAEEYYLAAIAVFLTGHPGWMIYLILLLVGYLFIHLLFLATFRNSSSRISFYYLWLPIAIFVILMETLYLAPLAWWKQLSF